MSVSVENLEKNMAKITVNVEWSVFDKAVETAYNKNKGRYNLPGFRKGKAPRKMIEKAYGGGTFYNDAFDMVLEETYPQAAQESGLVIVSRPKIDIVKCDKGEDLVYTAEVAVKPEVELGQYKGLVIERADDSVSDEDIEKRLNAVRDSQARVISDDEKEIADGDIAVIDFEGFIGGKAFEGGKGADFELTIGSHSFIDTFEDQLIGHKTGDEVDVNVTFPENYGAAELKGKPATFKVTVKGVKYKELPELDDEFASEVSEFETFEEFKADLVKKLATDKMMAAMEQNENKAVEMVVENAKIDVPQAMIDTEAEDQIQNFAQRLAQQGFSLEQYMQMTGTTPDMMKMTMQVQAEKRIRTRLVLEAIVAAENITVSDERIEEELQVIANNNKMDLETVKQLFGDAQREIMTMDIACQQAIDFVVAQAELVDKAAE